MRHIILISGKDSTATALVQMAREPDLEYEFVFNPTGAEVPEVYEWLDKVSAKLGKPIARAGRNLKDIIYEKGIIPNAQTRFCTQLSKIYPLEDFVGTEAVFVYYGLRADEPFRVGYQPKGKGRGSNIIPMYPLCELGLTLPQVWSIVEKADLLPPAFFWQRLYDKVVAFLGPYVGILETLAPWEHRALFAWRSRPNCYWCFFQRLYEWIGLYEHHPELYWQSAEIEEEVGAEGFTWIKGKPLRELWKRADEILIKRAKQIVKILLSRMNICLPGFEDEEDDGLDLLAITSCGLYCGK